ncbi:MAG: hypothetical protein EOP00_34530 [Pedobacter sp.]|nr:MAG: hypothetical protein EOP00_34530 [Pedobacter sp.]
MKNKVLFDRFYYEDGRQKIKGEAFSSNNSQVAEVPKGELTITKTPEVARLISSTAIRVDTKSDISYIKNAVMKIGAHDLEADEVAFDKRNKRITAKNGTLKLQNGSKVAERYIIYDLNKGTYITNSTQGNKIHVNSLAYDLLSKLYADFESYKISKIMDRVVLAGKIDFTLDGFKINASVLEARQNSEKIIAHYASLTTKDGVKVIGDRVEFDAVTKDYKVLKSLEKYNRDHFIYHIGTKK